MTHVVTDNCRHCRYTDCVQSCPVECFHVNEVRVYIDPEVCIDCSACIPACPVEAIVDAFDLAPAQQHWVGINAEAVRRYPLLRTRLPALESAEARKRSLGF